MSVQNKMALTFSIFLRGLTLIFLRMLGTLFAGSLGEVNEKEIFKECSKCYRAMSSFLVINILHLLFERCAESVLIIDNNAACFCNLKSDSNTYSRIIFLTSVIFRTFFLLSLMK